ncbi:PREDICTED: uncharacterized protein LOC109151153 [Ipomoea nil]|uniref:uncharacterized protein LOC109151153 n=1 Tax=Ipomoea nil TaxID=35883 RepID=UPI000901E50D|nr:PREDICTED: uncharacterized protein LOC109151153 [Ipomoea nil]
MGNYISCTMLGPIGGRGRCATVILPAGEIRRFYEPVNAAEVMLEHCPGHFLVNTKSLHDGRRFCPLGAVEELEVGNAYAAFAMKRVSSLVTAADMGALFLAAAAKNRRAAGRGSAKVLPADCTEGLDEGLVGSLPKLKLDDIEDFSAPDLKRRLSMCRSKKPLLETIAE